MYHNTPELCDIKNKVYRDRVKKRNALSETAAKLECTKCIQTSLCYKYPEISIIM